jgi:hypothetical protein
MPWSITSLVTSAISGAVRIAGTTNANRLEYLIQAAPGSVPVLETPATGREVVTPGTPFEIDVAVANGDWRVDARAVAVDMAGGDPLPTYDYLITSDAEWDTVFANSDATLSGQVIAVRAGTYTAKSLTGRVFTSTTQIIAETPLTKPTISTLTLSNVSNLEIDGLDLVNPTWSTTAQQTGALQINNNIAHFVSRNCTFRALYRGTTALADFDIGDENHPEFASISPVFNDSGVVTSLTINRSNVGDLLADGTYDLVFNNYSSVTFSVSPVATMTVSGGTITGTTLTSGGASNGTSASGAGVRTGIITWAGQQKMAEYLGSGVRTGSPFSITGEIQFVDCDFSFVNHGIKSGWAACDHTIVHGCTFDAVYQDYMFFGGNSRITIEDCFGTRPWSLTGVDPGDPHSDFVQLMAFTSDWPDVTLERNIFIQGVARGSVQGFWVSASTDANQNYIRARVVGNAIINQGATLGIAFENLKDSFMFANLSCRYDPTNAANLNSVATRAIGDFMAGQNLIGSNITENFAITISNTVNNTLFTNASLGMNGATIAYAAIFANHTGPKATIADIATAFTPVAPYASIGPFADADYIDHIGRTTNLTLEPSYARFAELDGQALSTLTTSGWACVVSGPLTAQSITVAGGEYRIADDDIGTGATAWTTSAGTVNRGQFLQARHTTSASGSTQTTTTLTLRGAYNVSFTSTTASVLTFDSVDNQVTAYSRVNLSAFTGETAIRKIALVVRSKVDNFEALANILADATATFRLQTTTATQIRLQVIGASRCTLRAPLNVVTTPITHFITLDFTNTNPSEGCYWATDVDGVVLDNTPGTFGNFDTRSVLGSGDDYGSFAPNLVGSAQILGVTGHLGVFGESDGGGVLLDGAVEFLWMDWGGAGYTLPDITQSSVRNKWLADLIEADGSGPTGSIPKLYYTGDAAAWNAGIANLGSLSSAPLDKQAGTYI